MWFSANLIEALKRRADESDPNSYQEIESNEESAENLMKLIDQRTSSTIFQNFNGTEVTTFVIERALAKADVQTNETYLKKLITELRKFKETLHYYVDGKRSDGLYKTFFWQTSKENLLALEEKTARLILQACAYQVKLPKKNNSSTYQAADTDLDQLAAQKSGICFPR